MAPSRPWRVANVNKSVLPRPLVQTYFNCFTPPLTSTSFPPAPLHHVHPLATKGHNHNATARCRTDEVKQSGFHFGLCKAAKGDLFWAAFVPRVSQGVNCVLSWSEVVYIDRCECTVLRDQVFIVLRLSPTFRIKLQCKVNSCKRRTLGLI